MFRVYPGAFPALSHVRRLFLLLCVFIHSVLGSRCVSSLVNDNIILLTINTRQFLGGTLHQFLVLTVRFPLRLQAYWRALHPPLITVCLKKKKNSVKGPQIWLAPPQICCNHITHAPLSFTNTAISITFFLTWGSDSSTDANCFSLSSISWSISLLAIYPPFFFFLIWFDFFFFLIWPFVFWTDWHILCVKLLAA